MAFNMMVYHAELYLVACHALRCTTMCSTMLHCHGAVHSCLTLLQCNVQPMACCVVSPGTIRDTIVQ